MMEIIFDHVSKFFDEQIALEDVSFQIEKGEFVFIIGKSGAGKSTLLKLILKQEEVTSGKIVVDGQSLQALTQKKIPYYRRKIGYMSPDVGLLKDRNVYENLYLAMVAVGARKAHAKREIARVLGIVGLADKEKANVQELSGGENARILLARALLVHPQILIADEPTANLDSDAAWDLMLLLNEINHRGITVIVASHARELVSIMKKRVITLVLGCLVADEKCAIYNQSAVDIFEERKILKLREKKKKNVNILSEMSDK